MYDLWPLVGLHGAQGVKSSLPVKDAAIAPGHMALQRCLDGISEGAASGTVPGRAATGEHQEVAGSEGNLG